MSKKQVVHIAEKQENVKQEAGRMLRSSIMRVLSSSILTSRAALSNKLGQSFNGKRDLYEALGYPQLDAITYREFYGKYRRHDVAGRIVDAPVDGSWQEFPTVKEPSSNDTKFEQEWNALQERLAIYPILIRLEKLTRIGKYGVLLFGFDDVKSKEDLAKPVTSAKNLLYLQPYGEGSAVISAWDKDPTSERFGQPLLYELSYSETGNNEATTKLLVHHTRVLHLTEGKLDSNVYGTPVLERVYNRLLNLDLIVGGSAEMFWQGAFPGYAFVADAESDITGAAAEIEAEIDLFVHDFKRYMKLQGLDITKLSSDVADPKNHTDVQMVMISIATGIPKRILEGSERGELSSSEDEGNWNGQLEFRRNYHTTPNVLSPVINKLIEVKVLTAPGKDGYKIEWPDLNEPTDKDIADLGAKHTDSITKFASVPEMELLVPFDTYLEDILGFPPDKVERIADARKKQNGDIIREEATDDVTAAGFDENGNPLPPEGEPKPKPKQELDADGNPIANYDPNQPRNPKGSADAGQWKSAAGFSYDKASKGWKDKSGKPLPAADQARLRKYQTPPAWTDVKLNPDANAALQVMGRDTKGRQQYRYSAEHANQADAKKFARLREFNKHVQSISSRTKSDMAAGDDTGAALDLILKTGFRPGGEGSTKADKQAFGATTLLSKHVKISGDTLTFIIPSKKGVTITHILKDSAQAKYIKQKQASKGANDKLFDTNVFKVRDRLKDIAGPKFKVKDIRTWTGTSKAIEKVKSMPKPKNKAEYKRAVMEVAKHVAAHLGNTPDVARKAYIDPAVFSAWEAF